MGLPLLETEFFWKTRFLIHVKRKKLSFQEKTQFLAGASVIKVLVESEAGSIQGEGRMRTRCGVMMVNESIISFS